MARKPLDEWDIETEILPYLSGVEGGNGTWTAWCPIHDDEGSAHKGLSLSRVGKRNLGRCHSPQCGATFKDIVDWRLGGGEATTDTKVTVRAKAKDDKEQPMMGKALDWWTSKTQVPIEVWEALGVSQNGTGVIFTFDDVPGVAKIRKPNQGTQKIMEWRGTDEWDAPPLWPSPGETLPSHISIWEGESDCGTARFLGLPEAYAATKGASADFPPGMFEELRSFGCTEVTVGADTDRPGSEFRSRTVGQALSAGLSVNVVDLSAVLSVFSGVNDLNGLLRYCDGDAEQTREQVERCTISVSRRQKHLDLDELDQLAEREIEWILPGLIEPWNKVMFWGPQKSYKTYIELDLARSLVSCQPFLNRPEWKPKSPVSVLLVQEEGSLQQWARRIRRLNLKGEARKRLKTWHRKGFRFTDEESVNELIASMREYGTQVVILDPLQRMMPGIDENDSSQTGIVWDQVARMQIAIPNLVVVIVHHSNKSDALGFSTMRGSTRHGGEVDFGLQIQKVDHGVADIWVDGRDIPQYLGTGETFEVRITISGDDEKPNLVVDASEITVKVSQVQRLAGKNKDGVWDAIVDGCTTIASITSQTDIHENTVRKYVRELMEEDRVVETENGQGKAKTYAAKAEGTSGSDTGTGEEEGDVSS